MNHATLTEPAVLRCTSTADFLAALPQITGFTATHSLFLVLFDGKRAQHALRIDLPESDSPADSMLLLDFICDTVRDFGEVCGEISAPALVVSSEQTFAESEGIPWRRLAKRIERRLRREHIDVRELCCIAPDGWASYLVPGDRRHPLSDIEGSEVAAGPMPELERLAEIPSPDAERLAKVAHWLEQIDPYDFPGAGPLSPMHPAPGIHPWFAHTAAVTRALRETEGALSPRMTARLVRSTANPARWFAIAMGVLTRPEFPEEMARDMGAERFERIAVDLDIDIDDDPSAAPRPGWSILRLLASICPDFTEHERLRGLRERLLIALSETPEDLRPGLLAFSAWVWWLAGNQSVALRQVDAALTIDPENELALMVGRLTSMPAYYRPFAR